jgi:hypothetical protein
MATLLELYHLMNSDGDLWRNVEAAALKAAIAIKYEDPETANHAARLEWSTAVLADPKAWTVTNKAKVLENATIGTAVGITADAIDPDATTNTMSYSLSSNPGGLFAIDAVTGVVTVASAIDREVVGPTTNITVLATSTDGSVADTVFTIAVADVNESPVGPVSDGNGAANTVLENAAICVVARLAN